MRRAWKASVRPWLACLWVLVLLTACAGQKVLVQNINQNEANEIVALLAKNNISATKQREEAGGGAQTEITFSIVVTNADYNDSLEILIKNGLPRPKGQTLLSVFGGGGLVPSETEEKIKVQAGKQQELARTIRSFEGVLDVSVQLALPEEDSLTGGEQKAGRASVYVKHQGSLDDPNRQIKAKIRRFVADSVDIPLENVTVVDERSGFITDLSLARAARGDGDKEYVKVWSVIVARESAARFQLIFFSMSLLTLISLLGAVWIVWRFLPVIRHMGGFGTLLSTQPVQWHQLLGIKEEKEEEAEEGAEEEEAVEEDR